MHYTTTAKTIASVLLLVFRLICNF